VTSLNKFTGGRWTTNKIDDLLASTIALGNYRHTTHRLPNGTPFKLILNGKWSFSDEALARATYKIVSAQIDMMGTWHFPLYSVVLSQSPERGASGSGLENAFEMFGDSQRTLDDFYYLISHENFHYWNGNRIRYGEPRPQWFSEGFTEYYTYVTVGRMKLGSMQANLDAMSKTIQAYSENPVAEKITFEQAGKHFWEWLPEYGHLFYSKGMLIALMADVHLRSSSNNSFSLDGFMRFLDRKYFNSGKTVDDNTLAAELENYSGFDWQEFFDQFIFGSSILPVNDYVRLGGMEVIDVSCKRPDLGFTMMPYFCADQKPCGYQALGVTKDGPAYRSGIREGDVITRWEPNFVQKTPPHTPVKFGIKGSDGDIIWHEYISEEKNTSCKQLAFVEDPHSMAKLIRDSVWQAGKSNLSDKFGALFQTAN
jgi:predicted metalloprotease with PDZ domain